jgi:hypothetical protein
LEEINQTRKVDSTSKVIRIMTTILCSFTS